MKVHCQSKSTFGLLSPYVFNNSNGGRGGVHIESADDTKGLQALPMDVNVIQNHLNKLDLKPN